MLCFVPVWPGCVWCYVRKNALLQSAITERMDMGLYEVPLSKSCFGMGYMLANFHMCGIMLVLRKTCSCGMQVQEGLCVLDA